MKIGCFIINISNEDFKNFIDDGFFTNNAINSFKKFHPDIELIYVNDDNFHQYLKDLSINEYFDNIGILRIHIIRELMKKYGYTKMIMLGADTFTCDRLDEFLNNNEFDMICSSGPPFVFIKTEYWAPKRIEYTVGETTYADVDFINADVVCFNNVETVELLYNKSLEFWSEHAEQGGMNYLYQNQIDLGIKVKIIDFPYSHTPYLFNVRSKGLAFGGNQMHNGVLYNGNYLDPNSKVIGDVYPTSTYYVKDNKLYTSDHKQIKVFHYAEALGVKTKEEYDETIKEIKTKWFNKETIEFLTTQCDCKFTL